MLDDALDAKRYRWLRDHGHERVIPPSTATQRAGRGPYVLIELVGVQPNPLTLYGATVDAAVDIAMAESQRERGES